MTRRIAWSTYLMALCVFCLAGCESRTAGGLVAAITGVPYTARRTSGGNAAAEDLLERIYAQVNPSVVHIRTVYKQQVVTQVVPEIPSLPIPQRPQELLRQGSSSGFVWDTFGHIVTNYHAVAEAERITVTFHDDLTVPTRVVGADPESDLAVVKVDVTTDMLHPARLGDSTSLKVGQLAAAIGNPFGLQSTMTVGIISGLGRVLPVDPDEAVGVSYTIPDIIQTDAPINPGSSGGVLVDDTGQMIGVTSAIISPVGASVGIGFAIPAVIVQKVIPSLIRTGGYQHPWLGLGGTTLTFDLAKSMGLKADQRGALVIEVIPGSPAAQAGVRGSDRQAVIDGQPVAIGGDVIVAIDGHTVKTFDDPITYLARATEVGQVVTLTVLRQGNPESLSVVLKARPTIAALRAQAEANASGAWLGIVGATVTPQTARAMHLPANQRGVLIERVEPKSPAEQAGLRGGEKTVVIQGQSVQVGGDILVAIDNRPITQLQELQTLLQQAVPGQEIKVTVVRNGKQLQLRVILAPRPSSES